MAERFADTDGQGVEPERVYGVSLLRKVLVTGITGTLGRQVLKLLAADLDTYVVGISRDEQKQRQIPYSPRLDLVLADIRDPQALRNAALRYDRYDVIFHFAALKCVDTLEDNPLEAVKTNVNGTQNIVELARDLQAKVVMASTDKAVFPINAYGMSKALAEHIVLTANERHVVCRYGNVLASRGSVLEQIVRQIQSDEPVSVTHPDMTRFWIRQEDAARFVFDSAKESRLQIPLMKSAKVISLVDSVATYLGKTCRTLTVGIRRGEKIHENINHFMSSDEFLMSTAELDDLVRPVMESLCPKS